jgi:hypothetical protein
LEAANLSGSRGARFRFTLPTSPDESPLKLPAVAS